MKNEIKATEEKLIQLRSTISTVNNQMAREKVTDLDAYRQSRATVKELLKHEKSLEADMGWLLSKLERRNK